jgi:hypothetical protein
LLRRVLLLPDTTKSYDHNSHFHNSGSSVGVSVDGRDRQMSLALAMQEVMLRMQALASQQEGTNDILSCLVVNFLHH